MLSKRLLAVIAGNAAVPAGDYDFQASSQLPYFMKLSRLSAATYFEKGTNALKDAAIDQPRFESDGLLVEKQSTNLFPNNMWTNGYLNWNNQGNATIEIESLQLTPTITTIKNGGNAAQGVLGINAERLMSGVNTEYNFSMRYKSTVTMNYMFIITGTTGNQNFRTIGTGDPQATALFQKFSIKLNPNPFNTATILIGASSASNFEISFNDVQFESLPYASSLIKTTGTAVTRAADILTFKGKNQSIYLRYKRQDNKEYISTILDVESSLTLNLPVGAHLQKAKYYSSLIQESNKNKELVKAMITQDHNFQINRNIPNYMTFSRLSAATYLSANTNDWLDAVIDQPRFEGLGLMIEKQSTNMALFSYNYNAPSRPLQVAGAGRYENGYYRMREGTDTGYAYFANPTDGTQNTAMTVHLSHETVAISQGTLWGRVQSGNLPVSTAIYKNVDAGLVAALYRFGAGTPSTGNYRYGIYNNTSDNSGVRVHRMQYEYGNYPTSLIKTNGAATTRAADRLSIAAINQTILVKYLRHDTDTVVSEFIDAATNHTLNLSVGCHLQRVTVFDHMLSTSEKNIVLQEINNV